MRHLRARKDDLSWVPLALERRVDGDQVVIVLGKRDVSAIPYPVFVLGVVPTS